MFILTFLFSDDLSRNRSWLIRKIRLILETEFDEDPLKTHINLYHRYFYGPVLLHNVEAKVLRLLIFVNIKIL